VRANIGDIEFRADDFKPVPDVKRRRSHTRVAPKTAAARRHVRATRFQQPRPYPASLPRIEHRHPAQLPRTVIGHARHGATIHRRHTHKINATGIRRKMRGRGIVIAVEHGRSQRPAGTQHRVTHRQHVPTRGATD